MAADAPQILDTPRCVWPARAALGEGTVWSPGLQALYWVDILGRQLHRFHPADGSRRSWIFDEEITAIAERAAAPGLLASLRHGLATFDPDSGALHRLPPLEAELPANRFNDGKCDAQGRFWAGSMDFACEQPTGALYRCGADGRGTRVLHGYRVTNGPAMSLDGRTLYFNDTVAGRVLAFDLDPISGELSGERLWLQFPTNDGHPDGMTVDAAGRLWIAHWGAACVTCHDPDSAAELARIALPARQITNCAFGGADLCTLYISSARTGLTPEDLEAQPLAGGLFAVRIGSPGVAAHRFAG